MAHGLALVGAESAEVDMVVFQDKDGHPPLSADRFGNLTVTGELEQLRVYLAGYRRFGERIDVHEGRIVSDWPEGWLELVGLLSLRVESRGGLRFEQGEHAAGARSSV